MAVRAVRSARLVCIRIVFGIGIGVELRGRDRDTGATAIEISMFSICDRVIAPKQASLTVNNTQHARTLYHLWFIRKLTAITACGFLWE